MEFIWNDGGRAACGFVGSTGDCVTRAVAIATGSVYRDVYKELGKKAAKSPRSGVPVDVAVSYLAERGWKRVAGCGQNLRLESLPAGVVIVYVSRADGRSSHLFTVVDQVVYDTWNAADDDGYLVRDYWVSPQRDDASSTEASLPTRGPKRVVSKQQEATQQEFDKILRWLKALDSTANNQASTEGEKRNALRMMQTLMVSNNLTRDDIVEDDNVDLVQFTRMSCPLNGRRACSWEKDLAKYVCDEIFPLVQWYLAPRGHRSVFIFYGPLADVQNAIALFRELLLTIATAAQLQYGGYSRGSGASYAEGYVNGLPRSENSTQPSDAAATRQGELVLSRELALHDAAALWLRRECNIRLTTSSRRGRQQHDPAAQHCGERHGAKHKVTPPTSPKRITHRPSGR